MGRSLAALGVYVLTPGACTRSEARQESTGRKADSAVPNEESTSLDRIGLQLYTVRSLMAEDVERTLEMVAGVGYHEVEFAGYFDRQPAALRATLDSLGLAAPATHVDLATLRDRFPEVLEAAATLGHRYVVLPWLAPEDHDSLDDYRRLADEMNQLGEACRSADVQFAYHNHDFEFERLEGEIPFDLLLARTDPELVAIELDLFWIIDAGSDPLTYFETHPGRFRLCHVKDRAADGTMVEVGAGVIDFTNIFARSEQAGLAHYFVEHDQPGDPEASIRASYLHLSGQSEGAAVGQP
jgi:sugar phosphate isomerase/epimerase